MSGFWFMCGADDFSCRMPPGLLDVYGQKQVIGVITKTDLPQADADRVESLMRENGIGGPIFRVTSCAWTSASEAYIDRGDRKLGARFVPGEALP
jgi:ethanolamine utilization protein EutP